VFRGARLGATELPFQQTKRFSQSSSHPRATIATWVKRRSIPVVMVRCNKKGRSFTRGVGHRWSASRAPPSDRSRCPR